MDLIDFTQVSCLEDLERLENELDEKEVRDGDIGSGDDMTFLVVFLLEIED